MKTRKDIDKEKYPRHLFKSWVRQTLKLFNVLFQYEYFFSVNNLCIGLSNFLVFPAKVHEYHGGAFIIAYIVMLFAIGYPVLYLELIIGQYHRCSPVIFIRRCVPILQGFGYMSLISAITILYPYQYSVARAFKFLVSLAVSRSQSMPWSTCDNSWNTEDCYQFYSEKCPDLKTGHIMFRKECVNESRMQGGVIESAEEQYLYFVVHKTGPSHMSFSHFDYGMACSIFILWLSIAFIQTRVGTKATPLIYVPTIFIFLICPFLLLRALHLDGAINGIKEMLKVEWAELLYSKIWMDALNLVIQSLSIGIGGHSVMASFAPKKKFTFQIATLAVIIDTSLSLIITGTVFSILGYISFTIGRDSVYDVTVTPPGLLLTHSTVPVLLRKVAHNAWLWVFLYYTSLVIVGWKSCALVLKTITTTLADILHKPSNNFRFDVFSMFISIVLAIFGLLLCFEGGPMYNSMIQDVQNFTTGLFITAQLLIVLEVYSVDMLYEDIYELMGRPTKNQWSRAYSWSIWKWRWRMAPAFSFVYVLSVFFRSYPSRENDLDYYNYYDYMQFSTIFFIVLEPLLFAYYAYLKMFYYMEKNEKSKKFIFKILWRPQRFLRSWDMMINRANEEYRRLAHDHLPNYEPEDPNEFWKEVYRPLTENEERKPKEVVKRIKKPREKPKKSKKNPDVEPSLTFGTYHNDWIEKE